MQIPTNIIIGTLLQNYGLDFFAKCSRYKTAKLDGEIHVQLIDFSVFDLTFLVRAAHSNKRQWVSVERLNNFVL